jgi:hypothetical protein
MSKRNRHGNYIGGNSIEGSRSAFYARIAHRKRITEKCLREAKQERERFAAECEAESRPKWTLIPKNSHPVANVIATAVLITSVRERERPGERGTKLQRSVSCK